MEPGISVSERDVSSVQQSGYVQGDYDCACVMESIYVFDNKHYCDIINHVMALELV